MLMLLRTRSISVIFLLILLATASLFAKNPPPPITMAVDATEAARKIFHARLVIPAIPGGMTLYYPKWIPGEHAPSGPIAYTAGLKISAGGRTLAWRRDLVEMYAIHVDVPAGVNSIEATLDYLTPVAAGGFSAGSSATAQMTVVSWNQLLLYPAGWTGEELTYTASLRLPPGWKFGTALSIDSQNGGEIHFKPVALYTLVDSPVISGAYFRVVTLSPAGQNPTHEMDIAADSAAALDAPPDVLEHYKTLVAQTYALFGARHYRDYHFLYSLSDHVAHFGLEHHESNDSRVGERGLVDPDARKLEVGLLPHEYVHSWNGKYRRPADLTIPNYDAPMKTDLLWVYEGLTSYLGDVLTARSGLWNAEQYRDALGLIAAELDHRPGRTWRDLQDTADGAQLLYFSSPQWESWRRGTDFYDEDVQTWLWADVIIRQQTHNGKSLDDFCKLFHGGQSGPPMVKTYTFDDVVNALNQVAPYDWRGFWTERLRTKSPHAPLGGIEGAGWRLVYDATPSDLAKTREDQDKTIDSEFSVGLLLKDDGTIIDTVHGMAAAQAGIGPGMKVIAVNWRKFSTEIWHDQLKATKNSSGPLELLVENTDYFKTYSLNYHEGEKYPHLVRDAGKPDLLSDIIKPLAPK